ncbi:lytic murein transglycosylase [Herbiconiux sp.]|uniref:lytic transglycosylase domain-containing protein n=1 Tax=Herbiconiux sp. TaxID=1871186 RepID=UPI0025BFA413|nr:lytic murein transglycosylase [Herbiconiux sp.]
MRHGASTGFRGGAASEGRRRAGATLVGLIVVGLLSGCALLGGGAGGVGGSDDSGGSGGGSLTVPPVIAEAVPASGAGLFADGTATAYLADDAWLDRAAEATGIPRRALEAYAGTALAEAEVRPGCHIGWNTLAAIGWVESHHGTIFGGRIDDDGRTTEPIYGVPLDGGGFQQIPDTDRGTVDGDTEWDRAVGPMQIIPQTWAAWASDGNFDGLLDINQIDDATLSAAEYLCYSGGDLGTEAGWRAAITAYNESPAYLDEVLDYAGRYAAEAESARTD